MTGEPLKLKATDDEDLEVFATVLQDAPMPLAEVTFLEDEERFAALFHRYLYERAGDGEPMQVDCALVFDKVKAAEAWDIGGLGGQGAVELMTIVSEETATGAAIVLVFHGGGHIRLDAESVQGRLADIGEPQQAERRPRRSPLFDA
jgi:hypothetical protein